MPASPKADTASIADRADLADDDLAAWLHLLHCEGVGREGARRLLAALGSPQAVLAASVPERANSVDPRCAAALNRPPAGHAERVFCLLAIR